MKIIADTNILIRAMIEDDLLQSKAAQAALREAEIVAVTLPALCELVWVLSRTYKLPTIDIAEAIQQLVDADNVIVSGPAVDAGLAHLKSGGDFADGVIAYEGRWLGADTFVSFDKKAVTLVSAEGNAAHLLG
jgi:predicted nucleic-acid-binding protein